jgi:transcriptional regulator with XRE-family HTH domain
MTKTTSTKQKLTRILGISNWSRDKLADLLQVSNNSLNSWLSGTSQPHATHTANIDQIYAELVAPLLCEIETLADKVEKSLLKDRINHLPDDNVCKVE